jgi:hypothetical protein
MSCMKFYNICLVFCQSPTKNNLRKVLLDSIQMFDFECTVSIRQIVGSGISRDFLLFYFLEKTLLNPFNFHYFFNFYHSKFKNSKFGVFIFIKFTISPLCYNFLLNPNGGRWEILKIPLLQTNCNLRVICNF